MTTLDERHTIVARTTVPTCSARVCPHSSLVAILSVVLCLFVVACSSPSAATVVADTHQPIEIGGLFALTGDAADWGSEELRSVQLAVDEANAVGGINGRPITLTVEDTQTRPETAVSAAQKLLLREVPVIIGPTWDESAAAVAPLTEEAHVVMISPTISGAVGHRKNFTYLFSTWYSDMSAMDTLEQAMQKAGIRRVAVVHNTNTYSAFMSAVFVEKAPQHDIIVVAVHGLQDDVADYRTVLLKAKSENLDAIYFAFTSEDAAEPFLRQARELQLDIPMFAMVYTESDKTLQWFEAYTPGVYHPFVKETPPLDDFTQKFRSRYGVEPQIPSSPTAYDAARLTIAAMRSGATTGTQVRDYLRALHDFLGVAVARINFDYEGLIDAGTDAFSVRTVENGTFVDVQ